MNRSVRFEAFGGPEQLHIVDAGDPAHPGPGQIRVRVDAAGLNPVDLKILAGGTSAAAYNAVLPSGNGNDFAGYVDEVGEGVDTIKMGDCVFGGKRMYAQGDFLLTDADKVVLKPKGLTKDQAGSLDIVGRTAVASVRALGITEEDTVLVSAAAGGVGVLAVQLARRAGATVIGTASPARHDFLRDLGVIPISYGEGLADRVRDVTPRVTAVLDNHGPDTIDLALELGVPGHRINTIAARGYRTEVGMSTIGGERAEPGDLAHIANLIATGEVLFPIDSVYPIERVREAYEHLAAGHLLGKVVLALV